MKFFNGFKLELNATQVVAHTRIDFWVYKSVRAEWVAATDGSFKPIEQ